VGARSLRRSGSSDTRECPRQSKHLLDQSRASHGRESTYNHDAIESWAASVSCLAWVSLKGYEFVFR